MKRSEFIVSSNAAHITDAIASLSRVKSGERYGVDPKDFATVAKIVWELFMSTHRLLIMEDDPK